MGTANAIGWVSLGGVLLSSIEQADSLGRGSGFRRLLLQNPSVRALIHLLAPRIVDSEMDIITANPGLRLVSNDVNPEALEHFSFEAIQILQENLAPFLVSILKPSADIVEDHCALWDKTPANLENNIEYDEQAPHNHRINPKAVTIDGDEVMPLGDDMSQTADRSLLDQGVATRNIRLVAIISLCILSYSRSKRTNLFLMLNGHYLFANHVRKRVIESLHQMGIIVSSETVWQALQVNAQAILSRLEERAQSQRLFLSYDNMNFYKKVRDQRLYNKAHLVNYTAGYVCFMNAADGSTLPYINSDQVQYEALNSLIANDFLLDQVGLNHRAVATRFILGHALE